MIESSRPEPEPSAGGLSAKLAAARSGRDSDLGQLFEATRRYLLLVANRSLDPRLQAKVAPSDLVQETLLVAHRDFRRFEGDTEAELLAWLRHILLHKAADAGRMYRGTQKRNIEEELSLEADSGRAVPAAESSTPSSVAISSETEQRLQAALARLPEDYRVVIELRSLERLPFGEIGRRMLRSEDAAGKLWFRALQRLHDELAGADESGCSYSR